MLKDQESDDRGVMRNDSRESSGPSTDAANNPVVDPTKNVTDLVRAQGIKYDELLSLHMRRQDDLRGAENRHTHEIANIRSTMQALLQESRERRQDDIRSLQSSHIERVMELRSNFEDQLREKEAARLNAIRAVDVAAVSEAAKVVAAQQLALANTLTTTADTMRASTQLLATNVSETLATSLKPLAEGLAEVQRRLYEQAGAKIQQVEGTGTQRWGINVVMALVVSLFGLVSLIISIVLAIHTLS